MIEVWAQLCLTPPAHISQLHTLVLPKLVCSGPPQLFLTLAACMAQGREETDTQLPMLGASRLTSELGQPQEPVVVGHSVLTVPCQGLQDRGPCASRASEPEWHPAAPSV